MDQSTTGADVFVDTIGEEEYIETNDSQPVVVDTVDEILARQVDLMRVVDEKTELDTAREGWIQESDKFYQAERASEDKRYSAVVGMNPKNDDDWKDICVRLFGEQCTLVKEKDFAISRNRHSPFKTYKELFEWLSRSEESILKGVRTAQWVDPLLNDKHDPREFSKIIPLGCGFDYAVILAAKPVKKNRVIITAKQPPAQPTPTPSSPSSEKPPSPHPETPDGIKTEISSEEVTLQGESLDRESVWSLYVARLTAADPRYVNSVTREQNIRILAQKEDNNKKLAAIKRMNTIAYMKGECGNFHRPAHAAVHGKYVSCFWSNHGPKPLRDILRIYKMPKLSIGKDDVIELAFPPDIVTHYELHWPYFVFACSSQYLFDIKWVRELVNAGNFRKIEQLQDPVDFIVVVDLLKRECMRAFESPGQVCNISLYPTQTNVIEETITPKQVKILWSIETKEKPADPMHPENHALFEDFMLCSTENPTNELPPIEFNYLWRLDKDELELREKYGFSFKSPPHETPRIIRRSLEGHNIMISDNNISTLIMPNPIFTSPEIYFGRDLKVIDREIYMNMAITLKVDYTVEFACIRAATPKDALTVVTTFRLQDLQDYGEEANKQRPNPIRTFYKAIWTSVDQIVVQFQDGTLIFFNVTSEQNLARLKEQVAHLKNQHETRGAIKELTESKVTAAIQAEYVKEAAAKLAQKQQPIGGVGDTPMQDKPQ